ncbi:MAG: NYN domain-containing protein [Nitrospirae bacterium]|nr:NYN domain-containing protein [Candidatus Manganitrophaceae bacterium]
MEIIVDGYNFIGRQKGLRGYLEEKRRRLIDQLSSYRTIKGFPITVVFDGEGRGGAERSGGVEVVFSGYGESADDVIIRMAEALREGCTVVSSDRAVQDQVRSHGGVAVFSGEFEARLHSALSPNSSIGAAGPSGPTHLAPLEDKDDSSEPLSQPGPKKGNPRRLSKAERRRQGRLKQL